MKRVAVGSLGGKNFGVAGAHGAESARAAIRCDDGSMLIDLYLVRGKVFIDIWLDSNNCQRPAEKLLYCGTLERLLNCSGLCWETETMERVYREVINLTENDRPARQEGAAENTATL